MVELCQGVLVGRRMPDECMGAECCGTDFHCGMYREVKLLEHAMNIVSQHFWMP